MSDLSNNIVWNETVIRKEIKKLDNKTGLAGASLPIELGQAKKRIGCFVSNSNGPINFYFSMFYLNNPEVDLDDKIDLIRHEYAHYMDYARNGFNFGRNGHGHNWEVCCLEIGARPAKFAGSNEDNHYKKLYAEQARKITAGNSFNVNDKLKHPKHGVGCIVKIYGEESNRKAVVNFESVGEKTLSLVWVYYNCTRMA